MATLGSMNPTIGDILKTLNPDGSAATIIELLKEHNGILDDLTYLQGNETDGHQVTIQTGLPTTIWRAYNQGIPSSKARTAQVKEVAGQKASRLQVDVDLANKQANREQYMVFQVNSHLQAMMQDVAEALFYSNAELQPGQIMGLAPRYSDLSAENGEMIIDAGGAGANNNSSIWLVGWGPEATFAFHPKGTETGIQQEDLSDDEVPDADGDLYLAHRKTFKWNIGLALADWRYTGRICNIPPTVSVNPGAADADNLITQMIRLSERVADLRSPVRFAWYMPRHLMEIVRLQSRNVNNLRFGTEEIEGKRVLTFDGNPVRRVDRLLNTEARVL